MKVFFHQVLMIEHDARLSIDSAKQGIVAVTVNACRIGMACCLLKTIQSLWVVMNILAGTT